MRLTAALFTPIGDATPGEVDTDGEIDPTDPAVLNDDHLLDVMSALVGRELLAEPFQPRPELIRAERTAKARLRHAAHLRHWAEARHRLIRRAVAWLKAR